MTDVQIINGDAMAAVASLPTASIQCCVTSPPYWGLRDYGHENQIGLEDTPEAYVARLVEVFRQVRRALRPDGTLWLNLGDSYAGSWGNQVRKPGRGTQRPVNGPQLQRFAKHALSCPNRATRTGSLVNDHPTLKPKDLIGIPWRVAFALQADGWFLRSDIIWSKPNPMPESVQDRPTKAHEYIFLLSKSARYYYDAQAIAERATNGERFHGDYAAPGAPQSFRNGRDGSRTDTKNARSVWTIPPASYSGAHFATFPPDLARRCILAGSRPGDTVLDPFAGSGTTAAVAIELDRAAVAIELNPAYVPLIEQRLSTAQPPLPFEAAE
jgi:DNA modification methylase